MIDFASLDLRKLLPQPLQSDTDIAIVADILSGDLRNINAKIKIINLKATLSQQSDAVLDAIAFEKHIEGYSSTLPRITREALIRRAIQLHVYKGTPTSLQQALDSLGYDIKIIEWFQYGGEPYHFKIDLDLFGQEYPAEMSASLESFIEQYKNVRSKVELVSISFALSGGLHEAITMQSSENITLRP